MDHYKQIRGNDTKDHFVDADCGPLTRVTISKAYNCHQFLLTYFDLCALNMYQIVCSRNDMVSNTLFRNAWHTSTPTLILYKDGTADAWYIDQHQSFIGLCWDTTLIKLSNPWAKWVEVVGFMIFLKLKVWPTTTSRCVSTWQSSTSLLLAMDCNFLRFLFVFPLFFHWAPSMASPFSWLLVPHTLHPSVPYHLGHVEWQIGPVRSHYITSWWFQTIEKILVKMGIFPK